MTDTITKLTAEIADCEKNIAELADEHKAWQKTDKDDKAAAETVDNAKKVLQKFYSDNNLNLMQKAKQPVSGMAAGDAPPPPPATWDGAYGGKTGESQGIVSIMEMVHEDIVNDRKDAKADEDTSQ